MVKPTIPYTEIMITRVCNLSCAGCSTYSDLPHKGYVTWEQGRQEIEPWLNRVQFDHFGLMGGEPLINPQIQQWLLGLRKLMPHSTIRMATNGLLLSKNLNVLDLLNDIGNVIFKITVHVDDPELQDSIDFVKSKFDWQPVYEYGIHRWTAGNNLRLQINRPSRFFMTHQNAYPDAAPYDSDYTEAFAVCHQKLCPLLYKGRIYKCSTSGLMKDTLEQFSFPHYDAWSKFWNHETNGSITVDSTDDEIQAFVDNISKPHWICQQCPTRKTIVKIDHLSSVERI